MNKISAVTYDIHKHRHIFSAWAAGRAAPVRGHCQFKVETAFEIINYIGLEKINTPNKLPDPGKMDDEHRKWRNTAISYAKLHKSMFSNEYHADNFTHGIAAKLINIYLKSKFLCGDQSGHECIAALHPPVDRTLLLNLAKKDRDPERAKWWKHYAVSGWSKFSSTDYEEVIELIKNHQNGDPLWQIERYWSGHQ